MKTTPLIQKLLLSAGLGALLAFGAAPKAESALIAHFRFDEGSGTVAANQVDPTSPGNFSASGTTWTTNVPENFLVSSAYHNDGSNGAYMAVRGDAPAFSSIADITVTGWINVTSAVGTAGAYDRIFSKRPTSGLQAFDIGFQNTGGGLGISVAFSTLNEVISGPIDFASGWVFFAVTRTSSTGAISIYLGDTDPLTALELNRTGFGTSGVHSNTADLMIGNTAAGTSARAGDASYSDFRFYDEVLDLAAIDTIRRSHLQAIPEPATGGMILGALVLTYVAHRRSRSVDGRH